MIGDKWTLLIARDLAAGPDARWSYTLDFFNQQPHAGSAPCATW